MSVFRNYDSKKAGKVNANAFPEVYPHAWDPTQRNVRANPGIPSQPQRIQPHERGSFFPGSSSGTGTLAPQTTSVGGCGGCGGCGGASPTPAAIATQPSLPSSHNTVARGIRFQGRGVGALRPVPRTGSLPVSSGAMGSSLFGGRGMR